MILSNRNYAEFEELVWLKFYVVGISVSVFMVSLCVYVGFGSILSLQIQPWHGRQPDAEP